MEVATQELMFSSGKDDWGTPPDLFAALDAEFHFTLDAAANADNALCDFWYGPGSHIRQDALCDPWPCSDRIWCNPPYSTAGGQRGFIARAAACGAAGGCVVMLLPARTDTRAFHAYIWDRERHQPRKGVEVRFLKGRLKFVGAKAGAPFPSMVVVFRG